MQKFITASIALFVVSVLSFYSCSDSNQGTELSHEEIVKRGEYLVITMGCNDCHTPKIYGPKGPELDESKLLSGHPADFPMRPIDTTVLKDWMLFGPHLTEAVGPWGVSFAANLTPDRTGLGNWTEEQFKKALTEGKFKGMDNTRILLPPMPWENFKKISDDDLNAIFTYLQSIPAIENVVPEPIPPTELGSVGRAEN